MQAAERAAFRHCRRIAAEHYENFAVGSWLLPRALRDDVAAIYAWARTADDLADEGTASPAQRLESLDTWERAFDEGLDGRATDPIVIATMATIRRHDLPTAPFHALLRAFRRDADWRPFATDDEMLAYCVDSANPVGHLVLALFGIHDHERRALADRICTGLQIANFCQDVAVDAARGRVCLPLATLRAAGCDPDALVRGEPQPALRHVIEEEARRAREWLVAGQHLAHRVPPQLAREVRLFAAGGLAIIRAIEASAFQVQTTRPTLSRRAKLHLVADIALGRQPDPVVRRAYAHCAHVTHRSGTSFAAAFLLLTRERRAALNAVYAFCRFVDDVADGDTRTNPAALLARWRTELDSVYAGTPTHPIGVALADTVRRFAIPRHPFDDLLLGVTSDLVQRRYETFEDLATYCYRVASTVGLACVEIFGYAHPSARDYARDLGIALQLTNIMRDVLEDGRRGRIYLPLDDLRRFDVAEHELLTGRYSPRLGALLAFECGRARAYYLRARGHLAPEDRRTLAPAEAMRRIYSRLLDRIEARHFDVFGPRITLSMPEKLGLAARAWGRARLAERSV